MMEGDSERAALIALARGLIDIDSTTGREGEVARWLAARLRERGYSVVEQPVEGDRVNVLATVDPPALVFSTHVDCVPPFFPSRVEAGVLYGRGACDAKGILAAQVLAAERLRASGERRVGLLFVAGEERGSDGARAAAALAGGCRFLVNGEPTERRLALATRGVWRVRLKASGRSAHTAYPELGESAIEKLVDALVSLRSIGLPEDDVLGRTHYTAAVIAGGVAPNVVPPDAEAEVTFRTVGEVAPIREALASLEPLVGIEPVLEVPPVRFEPLPGFEHDVLAFTTDVPLLAAWGQPFLLGPGCIHHAHTADEHVQIGELQAAVGDYVRLAGRLLGRA